MKESIYIVSILLGLIAVVLAFYYTATHIPLDNSLPQ